MNWLHAKLCVRYLGGSHNHSKNSSTESLGAHKLISGELQVRSWTHVRPHDVSLEFFCYATNNPLTVSMLGFLAVRLFGETVWKLSLACSFLEAFNSRVLAYPAPGESTFIILLSSKMMFVRIITWLRLSQSALGYHSLAYGIYYYTLPPHPNPWR